MGILKDMPQIEFDQALLKAWGTKWLGTDPSEPKPKKNKATAVPKPKDAKLL
jgi:hypothetical protein